MNRVLILFLFSRIILISSANYLRDSPQESVETQNFVKNSYYLITTPKVWMSTEETVCLVLLKEFSLQNPIINLKISSINTREIFMEKTQALNSLSQCIQMPINGIRAERALLNVRLSDIIDETLEIRVRPSNGLTLIETSKPIYRPNERLQFRIITLNDWLRPIEEQFQMVSVENSKSMPVMQWTDIKCTNGMIALDMPIAADNYYGIWKIKVMTNNNIITEKIFKVIDYETQNIVISIETPNYIYSSDRQAINKVCVRNSLGQLMNGKMRIFVSYFKFDWERLNMLKHITTPYDLKEVEINGCYDLVLMSSKLNWNSDKYSQRNLKLSFQYIDETNGFSEEKVIEIPVVEQNIIISFPSVKLMKQYFKPGLPYFGHVLISSPDYSPVQNEMMTVCFESRDIPWVSQQNYICEQFVSNSEGFIEYTIPPMSNKLKQIEIRVQSIKYPSIESRMVLEPTYSASDEYMTVKPLINRNHCSDSVVFDVLFNKPMAKQTNHQIYYQIIGRGLIHAPQVYTFKQMDQWMDQNLIKSPNNTKQYNQVFVSQLKVQIPKQSALNNNLIHRILMYYLDTNNNLIADSNVFLTTCSDQSMQSTKIKLEKGNTGNDIKLRINTRHNSTCSVRLTQNKPYNSLKKINQFIEKFNVRQESSARDKCEKTYNIKKLESESSYSPYTAPYGLDSMSSSYEPVMNYGDAWDSFNDIGLLVSSNAKLDESPCDWDLYPRDILSQLSEIRNNQMKYLSQNRIKQLVRNQIQDIERSLFNEVLDWNLVNTDSNTIDEQISHDLISTSGHLYGDTVCVNKDFGITYARNVFDKQSMNDRQFQMSVLAPKESRIGDTLVYKVIVENTALQRQNCFPIQLEFENSGSYEMVNRPKPQCICGNTSEPISMVLRPKTIGSINVKIMAKYPIGLNPDMISSDCISTKKSIRFAPQIVVKQLSVNPIGIVSKQVNQQIICNNNQKTMSESEMQDLSEHMEDNTDVIVTNELMEPMLRYVKSKLSSSNHNALDSLSAFAASYYLYSYTNNMSDNWVESHKNQLTHELTKAFQSLLTYRHSDGSYALFKSRKHNSDIGLTASVFKMLAQSKPYLSFIENGNRINRLRHTLTWIYEQQAEDGCFHINKRYRKSNVWPMGFEDNYQLTGYVLASLLEAGLDYSNKPLLKAYNCLSENSNTFLENIESKPLSAIFYTYIQLLSKNSEESKVWIKEMEGLNNLDESDLLNEEMLSYLGLSYYLSNDLNSAKRFGERLMKRSKLWRAPISCYAITKLWPVLKHKTLSTSLKVYGDNDEMVSNLLLNETHSHHSLVGHKISMENKGCLLVANSNVATHLATKSTNFDIKIDGLDKGFVTCNRRRITVCVTENAGLDGVKESILPVVRMQMITGFDVDKKIMKKIIDSEVVTKYKKRGTELMLFLHPFEKTRQSYCFTVPVVQKQELYNQNEAFIKIYDYYNEELNDVISYKIPLDCQMEQKYNSVPENRV